MAGVKMYGIGTAYGAVQVIRGRVNDIAETAFRGIVDHAARDPGLPRLGADDG